MVLGFGYDVGPMPAKRGATPAPNPVLPLLTLVNQPTVQEDLKLTDDQKTALGELASKYAGEAHPSGAGSPNSKSAATSARKRSSGGSSAQAARAALASQRKRLDDVLKADQRKRLEQIGLRVEGPLAIARAEVAKKVNLSGAQVKQVRAIVLDTRDQLAQLAQHDPSPQERPQADGDEGPSDPSPDLAAFEKIRQEASDRVMEVLKPAQKDAYKQLLGPPFDIAQLSATAPAAH
jgi:hypothetical protein